jgi:hypothetical protein
MILTGEKRSAQSKCTRDHLSVPQIRQGLDKKSLNYTQFRTRSKRIPPRL